MKRTKKFVYSDGRRETVENTNGIIKRTVIDWDGSTTVYINDRIVREIDTDGTVREYANGNLVTEVYLDDDGNKVSRVYVAIDTKEEVCRYIETVKGKETRYERRYDDGGVYITQFDSNWKPIKKTFEKFGLFSVKDAIREIEC